MGCAPYLDLQVLEFMKLELIETPGSKTTRARNAKFLQNDPVLRDYEDCFSGKAGKLPTKYISKLIRLFLQWYTLQGKLQFYFFNQHEILLKKSNTPLGFHIYASD